MEKFDLVYCDPPRRYNNRKTGGKRANKTKFWWGASKHYPLMKDKELLDMKDFIKDITKDNSIIFMWATPPRLDFAIKLMNEWWFSYKTIAFNRVKINNDWTYRVNPWYYTASNCEVVLLWIKWENNWRFKPKKTMINQIISEHIREHSRKPDIVRDNIDIMYPNLDKIELFARTKKEWWEVRWNQVNLFQSINQNE